MVGMPINYSSQSVIMSSLTDKKAIELLRKLSSHLKKTLIELCVVYPETANLQKDIQRAADLGTVIEYQDLGNDCDNIVLKMESNPRFRQLQSKEMTQELLRTIAELKDEMLNNLDYIIFQRINIPVLCLKNVNPAKLNVGVSAFVELTEARMKIHRLVDMQGPTNQSLLSLLAIIISILTFLMGYYNNYYDKKQ